MREASSENSIGRGQAVRCVCVEWGLERRRCRGERGYIRNRNITGKFIT